MSCPSWTALTRAAVLLLLPATVAAQVDYRNLDDERPVTTEDAYPVDRYALEIMMPFSFQSDRASSTYLVSTEIESGLFDNGMAGLKLPVGALSSDGTTWGLAGLKLYGLYNFNTETRSLPAFALRGDIDLPVGSLAGDDVRASLKAIATRSWGRARAHVNLLATAGGSRGTAVDRLPRWSATAAVDYTLFRQSLLLLGELAVQQHAEDDPTTVTAGLGMRWQWRPTLVLDAGISRRLTSAGPDIALTVGLSQSFGFRALMPAGPVPSQPQSPGGSGRDEQFYYPGSWNFQFLAQFPSGARLFNAFDYGHAVLYEKLFTVRDSAELAQALEHEYQYLTTDLLQRPPRYAVAEEAIEPDYAKLAWQAKQMFDWAHLLHRQIYDIYADPRLAPATRDSLIERATDYYLSRSAYAFTTVPKSMALMDEQPFSQVFRRREPKFNGLIWAYHWLQVGLYEPLARDTSLAVRRAGVAATLAGFWAMLEDPPSKMPKVMPMTAAVAPHFAGAHPRAAVIFDNLHMMHDIISDILLSPVVAREDKQRMIYAQLAEFRDGSRNVMSMEEWRMMGHEGH
jgi:hypothetical protein